MCYDAEFVSSETSEHIPFSHRAGQALGDYDQNVVSDQVPIRVVDLFESVQVEHQNRMHAFRSRGRGDRDLQCLLELAAVREACQWIGMRKFMRSPLRGNSARDLALLFGDPPPRKIDKGCHENNAKNDRLLE